MTSVSLVGSATVLRLVSFQSEMCVKQILIVLAWTLLVTPLFSMPSYIPIPANGMNYASAVFVGGTLVSAIWYFVWGRKNYQGPPTKTEDVIARRRSMSVTNNDEVVMQ